MVRQTNKIITAMSKHIKVAASKDELGYDWCGPVDDKEREIVEL